MSDTANVVFTGKDADLIAAYARINEAADRTLERLERIASGSRRSGRAMEEAGQSGAHAFTAFAQQVTGVSSALQLANQVVSAIRQEWEKLQRIQMEGFGTQAEIGSQMRTMQASFGGDETLSREALPDALRQISARTGATLADVLAAAGPTFSAKGAATNQMALDALEQALSVHPGDVNLATILASRSLNLMNAFGVEDPRQALGFQLNVFRAANVTDAAGVGASMIGQTVQMGLMGERPEVAAALMATMSHLTGDQLGAISGRSGPKIIELLREARGRLADVSSDSEGEFLVPAEQQAAYRAAQGVVEQLQVLWESPELARHVVATSSFDSSTGGAMRALLTGAPQAREAFAAAQAAINPIDDRQAAFFEEFLEESQSGPFDPQFRSRLRMTQIFEQHRLDQDSAGAAAALHEELLNSVDLVGFDPASRATHLALTHARMLAEDPIEARINQLRAELREGPGGLFGGGMFRAEDMPHVERTIRLLEEIRDSSRQQTSDPLPAQMHNR